MIFLLLLLAFPLLAQDVFSANDGQKPFVKPAPCNRPNCGTFFYDPNNPNGQAAAVKQCFQYIKQCEKPGRGCDCWTFPDRALAVPPIKLRVNNVPAGSPPPPRPSDHFTSGPTPPGERVNPVDLGPGLIAAINSGRCQTALHNRRDLYMDCPGYVPDFVNDRLQKDPTAPDPNNPAPIRLYAGISENNGSTGTGQASRFGLGNINEADPPLLITAKILQGIDDCLKENLGTEIAMMPINYATQRYRLLKSLLSAYSIAGNVQTLAADLNATLRPGQSLGDASYEIGRLLCDGYSLKDVLDAKKNPLLETEAPGLPALRPTATPKPTPVYKDPAVKSALQRGITLVDHKALQAMAQEKGWNIIVRDSSPYAGRWIGHPEAVAKPIDIKAKTLKPPTAAELARMTPAERAYERQFTPYYGLASAKGITSGELSLLRLKGYKVDDPTKGYLLRTPEGKMMFSDIDIHGIYDRAGNDAWPKTPEGERALIDELNDSTLVRMVEHPPQDHNPRRNDPTSSSFGPLPPATVYTHDGRNIFLDSIGAMESSYREMGIAWDKIYPR